MSHLLFKPVSRDDNLVIQELKDELLVYDLSISKAFALNKTASIIWRLCDGTNSIAQIREKFEIKASQFIDEDVVRLSLDELTRNNLLKYPQESPTLFHSISRREVIRRITLDSAVLLPVVSILTVPTAAQASSRPTAVCSTAAPGGSTCRCTLAGTPNVGDVCPSGSITDSCNANCRCVRTAATCPTTGGLAGTCQGSCVT